METIVRIIIPVLISICLAFIINSIKHNNINSLIDNLTSEHIVVKLPSAYLWVGCIDVVVMLFFLICSFFSEYRGLFVGIVFSLLAILGFVIIFATLVWKIDVFRNKDYFIYRSVFLKTHKIQYSDCIWYKFGTHDFILKTSRTIIRIDSNSINFEFLLAMLEQHNIEEHSNTVD